MKTLSYLIYIIMVCCVFSCQQLPEDDGWMSEGGEKTLKVKVRSAGDAEIVYPLYLYAFTGKGKLVASQTIAGAEDDMALPLAKGDFQVVALSGASDDYQLPESPDLDDVIVLSATDGADTPLMVGRANVEVGDAEESSAQITLTYVVAALNVKLKDIPSNVSKVQLALSPLHSSLSMGGEYGGDSQKVKVDCSLVSEGVWAAETTYIFPGNAKETVFSIYFKTDDGTEVTYGYTYQGVPEANHLFNVTGSYAGGVIVGGNFDVTDWEGSIDVEFEFGAEMLPDDDDNGENDDDKDDDEEGDDGQTDIKLEGVPEVGTIWNDMIVVDMGEADDTGVDLLLMSMDEWRYIYVSEADEVPKGYSINGISGWRYPTHDEAALLRNRFNTYNLDDLNGLIEEYNRNNDLDLYELADGDDERYLCLKNDEYFSFRFAPNTKVSKAGERSYYVRLVKDYRYVSE